MGNNNEYISVTEAAKKHGLSKAWVGRLVQNGRIEGAVKVGRQWIIPATWTPPILKRGKPKRFTK